jgi:putative SOS response-associated peptidase YedK
MCYYNGVKVTRAEYLRLKHLEKLIANYGSFDRPLVEGPLYNMKYPVLKPFAGKEDFEILEMEWGFLPGENEWPFLKNRIEVDRWRRGYKDEKGLWHNGYTTLNATCENLFINERGKPSLYRNAAMERRILIPSTGFFEWRHLPQIGKKGQPLKAVNKVPYFIYLTEKLKSGEPFYMAGICNPWTDSETGEHSETFAIVTTEANFLMQQVHNSKKRMPTILNEDLAWEWMFGKLSKERIMEIAKTQFPAGQMWAYTVAKDFKAAVDPATSFEYGSEVPPLIHEAA